MPGGNEPGWPLAFALAFTVFLASLMLLASVVWRALEPSRSSPARAVASPALNVPALVSGEQHLGTAAAQVAGNQLPAPPFTAADQLDGDAALLTAIQGALAGESGEFGVVVRRLSDSRTASLDPDREFYAASTFKLAVLYGIERMISEGGLSLDDTVTISEDDAAEDLGTLDRVPVADDGSITIRGALRAMVTLSDNATAVALLHLAGGAKIDAWLNGLGLRHTSVNTTELPTTAGDMALLMESILKGRGLNESSRDHARSLLLQQETRPGIPAGLPDGVPVGNKTGTWEGATHDIAFVEAPGGTYVIAILSDGNWAWRSIARISHAVYQTLTET